MTRRNLRGFNFERLENRRLLAADFGAEVIQPELLPVETCEVATAVEAEAEVQEGTIEEMDIDNCPEPEIELPPEVTSEVETEVVNEATNEQPEAGLEADAEPELAADHQADIMINELHDPVLGTAGHFGELSLEDPSTTLWFTPSEDGIVDVVVTSSFGEGMTSIEITDSQGNVIDPTSTESLEGFEKLTIDVTQGESYQLTVTSNDVCNGYFMTTVDYSEVPEPIDFHADDIGADSTELQLVDGIGEMHGELEFAGDVDTFRFVADDSGKALVHLAETIAETSTELNVAIYDADGVEVARGVTNEKVMVSFEAKAGQEYFVAVDATGDQIGNYHLVLEMILPQGAPTTPVDMHADEIGDQATLLTLEDGTVSVTSALETAEDRDAFRVVATDDGEMVVDLITTSEDHTSDATVSVFGPEGDLIVEGGTNEEVSVRFDVNSSVEYSVSINSINDIPLDYEMTISSFAGVVGMETVDDPTLDDLTSDDDSLAEAALLPPMENDLVSCEPDGVSENLLVDDVFAELGDDMGSEEDDDENELLSDEAGFQQV